eukprot:scaffold870_cov393-Prasinococcus_capsulatus_cf.AAC.18
MPTCDNSDLSWMRRNASPAGPPSSSSCICADLPTSPDAAPLCGPSVPPHSEVCRPDCEGVPALCGPRATRRALSAATDGRHPHAMAAGDDDDSKPAETLTRSLDESALTRNP